VVVVTVVVIIVVVVVVVWVPHKQVHILPMRNEVQSAKENVWHMATSIHVVVVVVLDMITASALIFTGATEDVMFAVVVVVVVVVSVVHAWHKQTHRRLMKDDVQSPKTAPSHKASWRHVVVVNVVVMTVVVVVVVDVNAPHRHGHMFATLNCAQVVTDIGRHNGFSMQVVVVIVVRVVVDTVVVVVESVVVVKVVVVSVVHAEHRQVHMMLKRGVAPQSA
jgi:hypothetical protein